MRTLRRIAAASAAPPAGMPASWDLCGEPKLRTLPDLLNDVVMRRAVAAPDGLWIAIAARKRLIETGRRDTRLRTGERRHDGKEAGSPDRGRARTVPSRQSAPASVSAGDLRR